MHPKARETQKIHIFKKTKIAEISIIYRVWQQIFINFDERETNQTKNSKKDQT